MEPTKGITPAFVNEVYEQQRMGAGPNAIPIEVLSLILSKLEVNDLITAEKVCKRFKAAIQENPDLVKELKDGKNYLNLQRLREIFELRLRDALEMNPTERKAFSKIIEQFKFKDFIEISNNPPLITFLKKENDQGNTTQNLQALFRNIGLEIASNKELEVFPHLAVRLQGNLEGTRRDINSWSGTEDLNKTYLNLFTLAAQFVLPSNAYAKLGNVLFVKTGDKTKIYSSYDYEPGPSEADLKKLKKYDVKLPES